MQRKMNSATGNPIATTPVRLLDLPYDGLKAFCAGLGEPGFRADQLLNWIYRRNASSFDEMSDLPISFRRKLAESAVLYSIRLIEERVNAAGDTRKALFRLADGETIETAWMAYGFDDDAARPRGTVCVSTQVGCTIGCPFCATGGSGFIRNLATGEIIEQVLFYRRSLSPSPIRPDAGRQKRDPVTNVVFMGMGEPLANYGNVTAAAGWLNSPRGAAISARQITVSTAGLAPQIRRLADEAVRVELAISLHAATDALRNTLVPLNRRFPLSELMASGRYFARKTGRRLTFEWALFRGVNDTPAQAAALAELFHGIDAHLNIIAGNQVPGCPFLPADAVGVAAFKADLTRRGVIVTVRLPRGQAIEAGCGQLRRRSGPTTGKKAGETA